MQIGLEPSDWFDDSLFESKYIKDNPKDFDIFFGEQGSLLYYPKSILILRGVSFSFTSSQNWTYDYDNKFAASAGGGASFLGIKFSGNSSYQHDTTEHKFHKSGLTLTVSDDEGTVRLLGYGVYYNHNLETFFKGYKKGLTESLS